MPSLRLRVDADVTDEFIPDFPFNARREFVETQGFDYQQPSDNTATAIPTSKITTMQAMILQSDKLVTVAMGNITMNPGGLIVLYNCTPATNPPTVNNNSGSTAKVRGVAFGA